MVDSHLLYGVAIWGSTFPSYQNKLASLQCKAVKLVAGGKYQNHVTPFYSQLNVLKLSNLVKYETARFVHSHFYSHLSPLLLSLFVKSIQIYTQITRAVSSSCSPTLHIPRYSTNRLHRSIMHKGVKIWNNIPLAIESLPKKQFNLQLLIIWPASHCSISQSILIAS